MKNILLVEDDKSIILGLMYSLESEGYTVLSATTVADAKRLLSDKHFDMILLDLSLPDGSGYDVCRAARSEKEIPVIFLTACDDEVNVVMGLEMGADDYITKPFRLRELLSRIKTVLRRNERQTDISGIIKIDDLTINTNVGKVTRDNNELFLTALEYRLLLTLVNHEGQILSRNQLLEGIWDIGGDFVNDNTLTVYIKRLREKIEQDPADPRIILTVRGLGYRLGDRKR
jgi:DNA-binding response OmpR family regulator